jgi:HEAT repeat protein
MNSLKTLSVLLLILATSPGEHTCRAADAKRKSNKAKLELLVSQLNDESEAVRISAIRELIKVGDKKAVAALISFLKGNRRTDMSTAWAIRALGELRDPRAVAPLVTMLKEAPHSNGKARIWWTSEALAKIGGKETIESLIALLENKNETVRRAAARALGSIGDKQALIPLIALMKARKGQSTTADAIYALGQLADKEATKPIVGVLSDKKAPMQLRHRAADALGRIGDKSAINALHAAMEEPDLYMRAAAAESLALMDDAIGIKALLELLHHKNWGIRVKMVCALGLIGDRKYVPEVLQILKNDEKGIVRAEAAKTLSKIGDKSTHQALKQAMHDSERSVRQAASEALKKLSKEDGGPNSSPASAAPREINRSDNQP